MVSALLQKLHLKNGKAQSLCTGPLSNKICSTPNCVDHFSSLTTFLRLRTIVLTIKCKKHVNPKWPLHYSISNPCMEIVEQGGKKQCAYKILCGRLDRCDLAAPGHSDEAALTSQPSLLYYNLAMKCGSRSSNQLLPGQALLSEAKARNGRFRNSFIDLGDHPRISGHVSHCFYVG